MDEGQWRRRETAEEQKIFPDAIIADPVAKGSTGHHRFSAVSGDSCKLLVLLLVLTVAIPVLLRCSGGDPVLAGWSLSLSLVLCLFGFTCLFSTAATPLTIIFVSLSYGGLLAYFAGNLLSDVLGMVIMYLDSMLAAGFFGSALAQHRQGNGAPLFVANDPVPMTQEKKRPLYILQGVLALGSAAGLLWMMLPISDYSPLGVAGNLFFALTIILWTHITCVLHWLNGALSVDDSGCIVLAWFFHVCALCFFFLVFMGELIAAIVLWLGLLASAAFLGYCLRIHASYEQIMIDRNVGTCPLANLDDNKTLGMSVELTRRNHSPSSPLNDLNVNKDPIMSEDPLVNLDDNKVLGVSVEPTRRGDADVYSHAASNIISGGSLEQTVQQILDMGGGTWERDMAVRALRAAYNNPERAIDYLYSGIPESVEALPVAPRAPAPGQQAPSQAQAPLPPVQPSGGVSAGPNAANYLNLIPQGVPSGGSNPSAGVGAGAGAGALDALRQLQEFQALLALVRANPQILQPMLQELGKQNPQILRLIQENQAEFLRLVNETPESGAGGNIQGAVAAELPQQAVQVTPEERDAIQRLEAMGFNRELVLEVLFACNRDEELAANYLLDHGHEFEEMQ